MEEDAGLESCGFGWGWNSFWMGRFLVWAKSATYGKLMSLSWFHGFICGGEVMAE